ncbi:divergent PAP2 family protein [Youxingia wuxianensis]|uniref:Divergent PAP2 family protein n=1 Tax=Youxingia wuxianensis TaxID=2763678 RepID=A0A926EIX9_9FIRM|nr:divergent PAP2 family protein [Youxingia wuxianensis]MBC8584208.1 divergent PAP2 family protein [Youxingia wuxianensis]
MNVWEIITSNYIINIGFLSWFLAQLLKTLFSYMKNKRFDWERLVGAGGMPSSHSSLVCSIAVGMAKTMGYSSPEFALSLALAGIVMYDAMGVRRAAGEQAKVLNKMVIDFKSTFLVLKREFEIATSKEKFTQEEIQAHEAESKELKEYLGHTPLEVLCGAILGIAIAVIVPVN